VRACVCIPTYNERENIERMLRTLCGLLGSDDRVLVIDDDSPDGTGRIAEDLVQELRQVEVLHRERKEGLGRAYIAGFGWALERGAELVLEMDCDFSHDPADVPRLIEAASRVDLVIGSRWIAGGATKNWSRLRKAISLGGSFYARQILHVQVRDLTAGFKCYRRRVLETIDFDTISARGYAFQIETVYRALRAGFIVREVPITFTDRTAGGSKMGKQIVLEAFWKVPMMKLGRWRPAGQH
jgi:dolichol-phosphate mannosyltransferase